MRFVNKNNSDYCRWGIGLTWRNISTILEMASSSVSSFLAPKKHARVGPCGYTVRCGWKGIEVMQPSRSVEESESVF